MAIFVVFLLTVINPKLPTRCSTHVNLNYKIIFNEHNVWVFHFAILATVCFLQYHVCV